MFVTSSKKRWCSFTHSNLWIKYVNENIFSVYFIYFITQTSYIHTHTHFVYIFPSFLLFIFLIHTHIYKSQAGEMHTHIFSLSNPNISERNTTQLQVPNVSAVSLMNYKYYKKDSYFVDRVQIINNRCSVNIGRDIFKNKIS